MNQTQPSQKKQDSRLLQANLFPKFNRFITELFDKLREKLGYSSASDRIRIGVGAVLVVFIVIELISLAKTLRNFQTVFSTRQKLLSQRALWIDIANKYPGYRDAYFQIAIISYQVGDVATEQTYLQKTILVDPNFTPAQSLEKITEVNNTN